jgi:hypothetical protein
MNSADIRQSDSERLQLWAGILLPPLAVLIQLEANYALVLWACRTQMLWPMHFVSALMLGATLGSGAVARRMQRRLKAQATSPGSFMAILGVLSALLFSLVAMAQWIPIFLYGPCQR